MVLIIHCSPDLTRGQNIKYEVFFMFGYVNAYKDLLRVCDYNVFRGYYCGLCKQLGKSFNQLTRVGLSYDMTFLAILMSSLDEGKPEMNLENCIAHPLSKRPVIHNDQGISYSADMSILLTYWHLNYTVFISYKGRDRCMA